MRIILTAILLSLTGISQGPSNDPANVAPKVTYCELIKHPEKFHDKVVEITAIFERDFEVSYLFDESGCQKGLKRSEMWVDHDKSFVSEGDSEEAKNNNKVSRPGRWSITATGRFRRAEGSQRFGHLGCCRYQFALIKILQAEKFIARPPQN
jgi:hypothetical protein